MCPLKGWKSPPISASLATIGGPRSPITTKKAMAVPARYPAEFQRYSLAEERVFYL